LLLPPLAPALLLLACALCGCGSLRCSSGAALLLWSLPCLRLLASWLPKPFDLSLWPLCEERLAAGASLRARLGGAGLHAGATTRLLSAARALVMGQGCISRPLVAVLVLACRGNMAPPAPRLCLGAVRARGGDSWQNAVRVRAVRAAEQSAFSQAHHCNSTSPRAFMRTCWLPLLLNQSNQRRACVGDLRAGVVAA
jgi:hypothetical protein